jgi:hypothetical protein
VDRRTGAAGTPRRAVRLDGERSTARLSLSVASLAVITIGLTAGAVWTFSSGKPEGGVLLAAVAIYLGHLLGLMFQAGGDGAGQAPRQRRGRPSRQRLATNPMLLYHALSFYHAHPDLRAELATPEAVERITRPGDGPGGTVSGGEPFFGRGTASEAGSVG